MALKAPSMQLSPPWYTMCATTRRAGLRVKPMQAKARVPTMAPPIIQGLRGPSLDRVRSDSVPARIMQLTAAMAPVVVSRASKSTLSSGLTSAASAASSVPQAAPTAAHPNCPMNITALRRPVLAHCLCWG